MKTFLNRFAPPFLTALLWTLVSQLPIWAQEATDEAVEEAAPVVPDLDPQLTEGAQQVNEMVDRFGLGDIPFAAFLISLAATFLVVFLAYFVVFGILRSIFRNFKSDLPLVALGASRTPATWVLFVLGCIVSFHTLPDQWDQNFFVQFTGKLLTAAAVIAVFHWLVQILMKVILYAIKQYADETEAVWDEVLVPFIEAIAPTAIYFIGISIAIQTIGIDLTGLWVTFGGAAFVLGFAVKDILADFFSGLVLLIDTPFRFGDVILFGSDRAIIQKIGLRTTRLYLIDTHSSVYIPNSSMQSQNVVNLSRPTEHYYYTIQISLPTDVDPQRASALIKDVVMAHPDTLGENNRKLALMNRYFGFSGSQVNAEKKLETGQIRVSIEESLNEVLSRVEDDAETLQAKIESMEQGGLDRDEIKEITADFLKICQMIGLSPQTQSAGLRGDRSVLDDDDDLTESMIHGVRAWYKAWLMDPNLVREDRDRLPVTWERKVSMLKRRLNRYYAILLSPEGEETRLDDYLQEITAWLRDDFKTSRNEWQDPKVWFDKDYTVKFYIDDVALEHGQRGDRIKSEVRREIIWHLRKAYLLN